MPTSSEIAASLRGMLAGSTISDTNRATIEAASSALLSQEELPAQLKQQLQEKDKRLTEVCAASAENDDLTLVAKGGETLSVKASLAQSASPYFATALDSGLREAGTRRIEFKDVGIVVLRFIVAGMHAGEACADLVALPSPHDAEVIEQIIAFSGDYLAMPWLAQAALRRTLESTDAAMLADLLHLACGHEQRERGGSDGLSVLSVWKQLCQATVRRLASMLKKASNVEAFFTPQPQVVQRMLVLADAMRRALEAVESVVSADAANMVDVLHLACCHEQRERRGADDLYETLVWEDLSKAAVRHLASMLEEAGKVEAFSRLPLKVVQRILAMVDYSAWPEWHELTVVAEGAGEVRSPVTEEGFYLKVTKHADGSVQDVLVFLHDEAAAAVGFGGDTFVWFQGEFEALGSSVGEVALRVTSNAILCRGSGCGHVLPGELTEKCVHGETNRLRFRARRTKLHVQCQVLLKYLQAHLSQTAQEESLLIVSALELLPRSSQGLEYLHAILVEYMAEAFDYISGEVLRRLSCCVLEAIITHPNLDASPKGEIAVLKAVLQWAQSSERLTPSAGTEVRVRDDSEHEQWRGAECRVVEEIVFPPDSSDNSAACLWAVERASGPGGETIWAKASDLLCAGHIGMELLLPHVRFPFIKLEHIGSELRPEERALANESPAFMRALMEAVEVQTGKKEAKELGKRAERRARYRKDCVIPLLDSGMVARALLR